MFPLRIRGFLAILGELRKLIAPYVWMMLATTLFLVALQQQPELRLNPPIGPAASYVMTIGMTTDLGKMGKSKVKTTLGMAHTFQRATGDQFNVTTKITDSTISVPPGDPMASMKSSMPNLKGKSFTMLVDSHAKVLSTKSADPAISSVMSSLSTGFQGVRFPGGPVKIGQSWNDVVDFSKMQSMGAAQLSGKLKLISKLVSLKTIGRRTEAKINVVASGTAKIGTSGTNSDMTSLVTGSVFIDTKTGLLLRESMRTRNKIRMPQGTIEQVIDMTMTRR